MTRDDIIRMAREANRYASHQTSDSHEWHEIRDERLVVLAAAAERKRQEQQLHTCSAACDRPLCVARRRGAEEEREACADICDQHASIEGIAQRCAAAIRARSTP